MPPNAPPSAPCKAGVPYAPPGVHRGDNPLCHYSAAAIEDNRNPEVVLGLEIRNGRDVDRLEWHPQQASRRLQPPLRGVAQAAPRTGEEGELSVRHGYRLARMRPATAAVIIALLVLILASSLVWVLRGF